MSSLSLKTFLLVNLAESVKPFSLVGPGLIYGMCLSVPCI